MNRNHLAQTPRARQYGLTLVELMIGLVIGLVMTGAISYLFIDASRNYRVNENLARMQESVRFAVDKIGRDARGAGNFGCAGEEATFQSLLNDADDYLYDFGTAVQAFEVGTTGAWPADFTASTQWNANGGPMVLDDYSTGDKAITALQPGSDIVTLRGLPAGDIFVEFQPNGASIQMSKTADIQENDILLVTTCKDAAVFQVTGVQKPTSTNPFTNVVHSTGNVTAGPGNATNKITANLTDGSAMRIATTTYFVAVHPFHGRPSLFRRTGTAKVIEIARNVVDMQITGGVDNNDDRQIDVFETPSTITAANNWEKVRAIRVQLTLESEDGGLTPEGEPLSYTMTTTIALRNRLP